MDAEQLRDKLVGLGKQPEEDKYSLLYLDPPWLYPDRKNTKTKFGGGMTDKYAGMKTRDICNLPVGDIASSRALCFMWVTGPRLPDGLDVMKAYGFKFSTIGFVWTKINKDKSVFFGPGSYTGSNCELVLIGRRGKALTRAVKNIRQPIICPRLPEHSQKPEEVRKRIDLLYPSVKKIELFARTVHPSWSSWGLDVPEGFVEG